MEQVRKTEYRPEAEEEEEEQVDDSEPAGLPEYLEPPEPDIEIEDVDNPYVEPEADDADIWDPLIESFDVAEILDDLEAELEIEEGLEPGEEPPRSEPEDLEQDEEG